MRLLYIYASEVHAKHGRGIDEIDAGLFLDINDIAAYKIEDRKISDIKNSEYNLIDTTEIDDCSSMINSAYDKLVALDED